MKKLILILGVIVLCHNLSYTQITTKKNVAQLFDENAFSEYFTIERAAAMEFHKLLNEYRVENGSSILQWDEDMWLAARNHCYYMYYNNHLTHRQANISKGFTGENTEDRIVFATNGNPKYTAHGENCLYNYSKQGEGLEEISLNIAKESFEQWKNSPGHNANMLEYSYRRHGTAFLIGGGKVWGTDVLSMGYKYSKNNDISIKKHKKQSLYITQKEVKHAVLKRILESLNKEVKQNKKMNSEANRKVRAIIHVKTKTRELQNVLFEKQDIIQTNSFLGLFPKNKNRYSVVLEKSKYEFNQDEIIKELVSLLIENQNLEESSKIGLSVAIVKRKKGIRVALVSIIT